VLFHVVNGRAGFEPGWLPDAAGVWERKGAARRRRARTLGLPEPPPTRRGNMPRIEEGIELADGRIVPTGPVTGRRRAGNTHPFPVTVRCDRCQLVTTFSG